MNLRIIYLALGVLLASACSSYPAPSAAPPPASAPTTAQRPAANDTSPKPDRELLKAGYEAKVVKGEVFYCRREEITGSQFKLTVCLNEAQVREEQRKSQAARDSMMRQRPYAPCTPMPQCAS